MPAYSYPGVYAEESNLPLLSIPSGATAVPVFMGKFAAVAGTTLPVGQCIEVASWFDFTQQFATPAAGTLAVTAVESSDPPAWTLGAFTSTPDLNWLSVRLYFDNGGGRCYILPLGEPADYSAVPSIIQRSAEITLLCSTLGVTASEALYDALSSLQTEMGGLFLIADSPDGVKRPATVAQRTAVYYPGVCTAYSDRPSDAELTVTMDAADGVTLASLKASNETLYGQISQYLDGYASDNRIHLPASPAITGVFCRTDASRGPWQAPAGRSLNNVVSVDRPVTALVLDKLLENRINAVKFFSGVGVCLWGARTMVPPSTPLWLHIQVTRLFDAAARDIKSALHVAVFRPNNSATWAAVRSAIESYLYNIWREGGLKGATAEEAYYVQIGHRTTMTDEDVAEGRLVVNVGMAALRPAEFIEVVFSQVLTAS